MAEPRVYPERPLIEMFLFGYEQGAWKDSKRNWSRKRKRTPSR